MTLEDYILDCFKNKNDVLHPDDVRREVRQKTHFFDSNFNGAIWSLITENKLKLTSDKKLKRSFNYDEPNNKYIYIVYMDECGWNGTIMRHYIKAFESKLDAARFISEQKFPKDYAIEEMELVECQK